MQQNTQTVALEMLVEDMDTHERQSVTHMVKPEQDVWQYVEDAIGDYEKNSLLVIAWCIRGDAGNVFG